MKLKIIIVPNSILRKKSKPIKNINQIISNLAKAMIQLIKEGPGGKPIGIGLSAVQIGKLIRLFVAFNPETKKYQAFVNPEIIKKSKELTDGLEGENKGEGCLSIPGFTGVVKRHQEINLKYQNLAGQEKEEKFSGLMATIIQHEYDHLEGILFTDRVLEQGSKIYELQK